MHRLPGDTVSGHVRRDPPTLVPRETPITPRGILGNQARYLRHSISWSKPRGLLGLGLAIDGGISVGLGIAGILLAITLDTTGPLWQTALWDCARAALLCGSSLFALYGLRVFLNLISPGRERRGRPHGRGGR